MYYKYLLLVAVRNILSLLLHVAHQSRRLLRTYCNCMKFCALVDKRIPVQEQFVQGIAIAMF